MTTQDSTHSGTLSPELQGYADSFEAAKTAAHEMLKGLSDEQFNWRPGEERWSVAECLDHLISIGNLMLRRIDEGIERAEAKGWKSEGPFKYGALGNWFVKAVGPQQPGKQRKFKAPDLYAPTSNHSIARVEPAFTALQDDFIERLHQANGYNLAKVKVASPALALLRLSLGQWFALLAGHQERHFQQARDVLDALER